MRTGKLCPKGWRIATDKDWNELEQFLGLPKAELERTGERGNIADSLKKEEGISMLLGGSRLDNGEYSTINQYGNYWTSTVYDDRYGLLYLWNHHITLTSNAAGRIYTLANNGYSCRCIMETKPSTKTTK